MGDDDVCDELDEVADDEVDGAPAEDVDVGGEDDDDGDDAAARISELGKGALY